MRVTLTMMMLKMTIVNVGLAPIPAHIYILKPSQGLARRLLHPAYASWGIYCTAGEGIYRRVCICIYRNAGVYALPRGIYCGIHRHSRH